MADGELYSSLLIGPTTNINLILTIWFTTINQEFAIRHFYIRHFLLFLPVQTYRCCYHRISGRKYPSYNR